MGNSQPEKKVNVGQAKDEVLGIFGRPNGPPPNQQILDRAKQADSIGIWTLAPRDTLIVAFKEDVVTSYWHEDPEGGAPNAPSKAEAVAGKIAEVGASLYFSRVCPGIYRRPALLMSAADMEVLQACNANGFMLFGLYIYTGGN
jgi:hypothetical protein